MKRSTDRILTTHAGRLQGSPELAKMTANMRSGNETDWQAFLNARRTEMADVIRKQADAGVDVVSDGELGKVGGYRYYSQRMSGLAVRPLHEGETAQMTFHTNERLEFKEFYDDMNREGNRPAERTICAGPIEYIGHEQVKSDIDVFKAALAESGAKVEDTFMCVLAPGWIEHYIFNEHYKTQEEFVFAVADAMKSEYKAIVDAGFILQLDDPALATKYDMFVPSPPIEEYREKVARVRVEAVNHALQGIPADRVRYHLCFGSWHGPHTHDLPLKSVVDLMLQVNAGAYSIEAGNPRHEHEWKVWQDTKLPDGKILIPGVVSHASNVVEHPELVADRIVRFSNIVGKENFIAGTDCGMGGRVHMQIGWAKLKALSEGAALASKQLWN